MLSPHPLLLYSSIYTAYGKRISLPEANEACPMASTPARPRAPSTPQPIPLAGSPAPTRHSRHQAQRSQHAKRSQGLHVEAAFPPRRPSLLRIDLLQGHGEKPEKAQKREGRGEKKEGQGGRERREDEGQGSVMESELCRQEGEGQGSASSGLSPAPECTQGWAQPALPIPYPGDQFPTCRAWGDTLPLLHPRARRSERH